MRIKRLVIENFNCFEKSRIDFDQYPSLTMLAGQLHSAGASSNGSGKTTILEAIVWATFGREMRKRAAGSVIRNRASSCRVVVVYGLDDGDEFEIARMRKRSGGTTVVVDGEKQTKTGAEEVIYRRLGFTFELFTRTVIFGGEMSSFCRMTAAERMKVLEELIGIEHFLRAGEGARARLREVEAEFGRLDGRHQQRLEALASARRDFRGYVLDVGTVCLELRASRNRLLTDLVRGHDRLDALYEELDAQLNVADDNVQSYRAELGEWQSRMANLRKQKEDAGSEVLQNRNRLGSVQSELRIVRKQIAELEKDERPTICPTCKRAWPRDTPPPDTSALHASARSLVGQMEQRQADVDASEGRVRRLTALLEAADNDQPIPPTKQPAVARLRDQLSDAEADVRATLREINRLLDSDPSKSPRQRAQKALRRLRALRDEGDADEDRRAAMGREIGLVDYWRRAFSRDGIPSLLMDAVAPTLNRLVKPFADILTQGTYRIRFNPAAAKGSRTEFRVEASNVEGGDNYDDLSRGELVRVDLCVLFAIRELMQERAAVTFDQVFIDELFDGMDPEGMEYAARLLQSQRIAPQMFFISHHDALKDAAEGAIVVEKRRGISRVRKG